MMREPTSLRITSCVQQMVLDLALEILKSCPDLVTLLSPSFHVREFGVDAGSRPAS